MGQTLTHGVYLPDEGERNCYDGLASNWQLLDGAVGTVAEHTTQIAGKAPAVHTHTKSDITDLFNSANTWTNDQIIASSNDKAYYIKDTVYELGQTYSNGEHLGGLTIQDKNSSVVALVDVVDRSYGDTQLRIRVSQKFDENSNDRSTSGTIINNELLVGIGSTKEPYVTLNGSLRIGTNNAYDLGTSAKQWNNLYAKRVNTQSVNGINPGALSLPDTSKAEAISTSGFSFDGTAEQMPDTTGLFANGVAQKNGWLEARLSEGTNHYLLLNSDEQTGRSGVLSSCLSTNSYSGLIYGLNAFVPITAGCKPSIRWSKPSGGNAILFFVPSYGNVS